MSSFVPSATLADLFGPNARTHPPGAVVAAVPGAFASSSTSSPSRCRSRPCAFAREALRRADAADLDRTEARTEANATTTDVRRDVGVDPDARGRAPTSPRERRPCHGMEPEAHRELRHRRTSGGARLRRDAAGKQAAVSDELAFSLALSGSKAQAAWAHRRWVICTFESATRGCAFAKRGKAVPSRARFASESEVARVACLQKAQLRRLGAPPVVRARPARRRARRRRRWRRPLFRTKAPLRERAWWMRSSSARSASCASTCRTTAGCTTARRF